MEKNQEHRSDLAASCQSVPAGSCGRPPEGVAAKPGNDDPEHCGRHGGKRDCPARGPLSRRHEDLQPETPEDVSLERKVVAALLGAAEAEELGGGLSQYAGDGGTATFRNNGEFSVKLEPGIRPLTGEPEDVLWELLEAMEIKGDKDSLQIVEADGLLRLSVRQLEYGYPVFDCYITFEWEAESLRAVSGRRLAGAVSPVEREGEEISAATALFRFLSGIKEAGDIRSEVSAMTLGYRFSSSLADTLEPFWLISTDTGMYYVNGITGETNRA
jgi:hypothetical protein